MNRAAETELLAGYLPLAELGRGAAATVHRVRRPGAVEEYALKILNSDAADAEAAFRREAVLLASVDHPGLVRIHEVGSAGGRAYLVMDLVDGETLARLLAAGPLPPSRVIELALDLVDPLAAAHRAGLVHRDLKPHNVMVRPDGHAQLIDFGLATRASGDDDGRTVGTLVYSAPEQAGTLRRPVDQRSDLYSLGVVLYECLAGRPPFASDDAGELLRMHAVNPPPDLPPDVPPALTAVVGMLLAKDPDDRYQRADDLAADLRRAAVDPDSRPHPGRAGLTAHQPMVGRLGELATVVARWEAALTGNGGAVVIRGGAGIGKTRLLGALVDHAVGRDAVVLHADGAPDNPGPFAALRRAVDGHLADLRTRPDRDARYDRIRECAGPAAPLLSALSPALAEVLCTASREADDDRQDRFVLALAAFLTTYAGRGGGLLLTLDDAQWLDRGTARVLEQLDVTGVPLLTVATTQDSEGTPGPDTDLDLTLEPLPADDAGALVRQLVPGTLPTDELHRTLVAYSRGNPLVVQEYLRAIVDAGLLRPSWGSWILDTDGLGALELPRDALGLLLTRVNDLDPLAHDLLATAAVVGIRFEPAVVAEAHGADLATVHDLLTEAVSRGLVETRDGGGFAFLHNGIREALRAGLDGAEVVRRHVAAAAALEAVPAGPAHAAERVYAIAGHLIAAGVRSERARTACAAAGERSLQSYAPAEAVTFLTHAVEAGAPDARLLQMLALALRQTGRIAEAVARLEEALPLVQGPLPRAEILTALAVAYRSAWNAQDGYATVDRAFAALGARRPGNPFAMAVVAVAMLVAATVMRWTGIGSGTASGETRRRCELMAELDGTGSYLSMLDLRLGVMMGHTLRSMYWVTRLGSGPMHARANGDYGGIAESLGLHRASRRAFDRAEADPAAADPTVRAYTLCHRAFSRYIAYRDRGASWNRAVVEHGPWLDLSTYADITSTYLMDALAQGRNEEAARWWRMAERRVALGAGESTALFIVPALLAAAEGRPVEAANHLNRASVEYTGTTGTRIVTASARLHALHEQDETGPDVDAAVEAYAAVDPGPRLTLRPYRVTLFHIAMLRIAQARAAHDDPGAFARHLAQARLAVRHLRTGMRDDLLRSWARIARADLLTLTGQPHRALRELDGDHAVHDPPAPLLAYEAARVRARALAALGDEERAQHQILLARSIAERHGWTHRALRLSTDGRGTRSRSSSTTRHPRTDTGHSTDTARDRERLRALQQVGAAASRVLDPEELARIALDQTIQILRADRAFLFLTDGMDLTPHLGRDSAGADAEMTGYSTSLVERVRATRLPLVVTGTEEGAALGAESVVLHNLRSILAAPLLLDDRLLGVVYLDSQVAKGIFTADDANILIALTTHIATSLETARAAQLEISVQTERRQRDLAERLREAFEAMTDTLDPAAVLDRLVHWTSVVLPNDGVWLVPPGDGLPDRIVVGADVRVPAGIARQRPAATGWAVLPLRSRDADLGALVVAGVSATAGAVDAAAALVAQGLTAHDNASLFAKVRELAVVDELTGIANRRRFFELAQPALAAARSQGRPLVAMMLDIDNFKRVNDTLGHPTGDDVIRAVASRLAGVMRPDDVHGRYGGEEFAVLLTDTGPDEGMRVAERIRHAIADTPIDTRTGPHPVTVSVGVASIDSDQVVDSLLARADRALYDAKQSGRNRVSAG